MATRFDCLELEDLSHDKEIFERVDVQHIGIIGSKGISSKRKNVADSSVMTKAIQAATCNAAKEAVDRHYQLKDKTVCVEDSKACRNAREKTFITSFFTNSLNPTSRKPLRIDNSFAPFGPQASNRQCVSIMRSLNTMSLDTDLFMFEPPVSLQKDSSCIQLESI